jgi:hypothetical protein
MDEEKEEMRKHTLRLLAVSAAYFALSSAFAANAIIVTSTTAGTATGTTATGTAAVPASRIASRFESLAGSPENAASLVAGLRSGTEITLSSPDAATGVSFTPTTRPMGYDNITRALTLAQRQLAAQGITEPTPEQLHTALNGGTLTTVDSSGASQTVEMAGVLQLRGQGMGWGRIAHQIKLSPDNRPTTTSGTTATTTQGSSASQRGSSYSRGAIVSGDGGIMHGRAPGTSAAIESHGQAQARGQARTHPHAPVIEAGAAPSHAGNTLLSIANHGNGPVHSHGNGRF